MAKIKGFDALPENIKSKLQDLSALLKEVTIDKDAEGWVYKYRSKSELSAAIYEDFIKYNEIDTNKTLSFIFSDEITNSGILSCTQAFQTLAILVSKLGLKTTAEHKKLIKKLFSQILNTVCKEDGGYLLDASPYLPNSDVFKKDNYKYAYIDTITWVMSSLLSAYRLHINKQVEFNEEELEMSYKLFNYCINYLNDSFIEDKDVKHKLAYGWNYTKDCEQVSLYFTFAVSEVLIDVLKVKGIIPKLAVIMVGDDASSKIYVRNKSKACEEIGIFSETIRLPESISQLQAEETVKERIREMGKQISAAYEGKELHLICVLRGGSFFMCELAKYITVPVSIDFMSVSSYGAGTESSGNIKINKDLDDPIAGKHVLVVEDIIDSGRTLSHLMELLESRRPESLALCTLLDKPERRVIEVDVDYTGFEIPDLFVVGYGLDYAQKYRNLPYIGKVCFDNIS